MRGRDRAPEAVTAHAGAITVAHSVGSPIEGALHGQGIPGEVVLVESEFIPFDASGLSDYVEFDLSPEAVSFSVGALDFFGGTIDIVWAEGPGGKIYEAGNFFGPWYWYATSPNGIGTTTFGNTVLSTQLPLRDGELGQLVAGGGRYRLRFAGLPFGGIYLRIAAKQRRAGNTRVGTLDLNVFVSPATGLDHMTAPNSTRLRDVLARADEILAAAGVRIGDVHYYDIPALYDDAPDTADVQYLFGVAPFDATPSFQPGQEERLNLFFIDDLGPNVLGVSYQPSGKPGPLLLTSEVSGCAIVWNRPILEAGSTTAHELCHSMGLLHTAEDDTFFDFIDDTLNCYSFCPVPGNDYLMFPFDLGDDAVVVTDGQRHVITRSPFVRAGLQATAFGTGAQLAENDEQVRIPPTLAAVILGANSPHCATCAARREAR
jgi:hypothetical protein